MNNTKKFFCSVGIILASFILLMPFFCTLLLSFQDYTPLTGLFGSVWVGFGNISSFLGTPYFTRILSNTLTISILGTVIGSAYVFVSSLSIGSMKNQLAKGLLAAAFAMPAVVPVNLFINALPTELLMQPSFLLQLSVSAIDGLRLAGLFVIVAFFIKNDVVKESIKCMLIFVAIRLVFILTNDLTIINGVYNPLTYEILDVLSSYTYRTGLMNGSFSPSAAAHIIKTAASCIPAILACVILIVLAKSKKENAIRTANGFWPAAVAVVIPVAILVMVIITGGSLLPTVTNEMVITGYINEFVIAFVSALLVAAISLGLAALARNAAGQLGIIALVLLCLTGNSVIGKYITARSFGLANTLLGVIFYHFSMISVLSLLLFFATQRERSIKRDISALIIGFILMFSRFWGDGSASMVMTNNREIFPLSLILRELTMQAGPQNAGAFLSTAPYILIPVAVVFIGFVVCSVLKKSACED